MTFSYTGKGGRRHRKKESFTVYEVSHRRTLCVCAPSRSVVSDSATPLSIARQAPLCMRVLQARGLKWVTTPSPRGSSQHRLRTQVSRIAGRFLRSEPPGKAVEELDVLTKRSVDHPDDPQIICCLTVLSFFPGQLLNSFFSPVLLLTSHSL